MRRWTGNVLILLIAIVASLLIAEGVSRLFTKDPDLFDERYGWSQYGPKVIHTAVYDRENFPRNITIEYFNHGFKRWGDVNTTKPKVIVIGDSFTEMVYVNNGEEWYAHLERAYPQIEWFVYGVNGYGPLQELFVLQDYLDIIEPDAVLLQTTFNDFINNDYQAELLEYPLTNLNVRPYLENGRIVYRQPVPHEWLRRHSRIYAIYMRRSDEKLRQELRQDKEAQSRRLYGENYSRMNFTEVNIWGGRFEDVLNTTHEIFGMMRRTVGDTPLYIFSVDDLLSSSQKEVAEKINATYIEGVGEFVSGTVKPHQVPNDGHWNLLGNERAGKFLVLWFDKHGFPFDLGQV